MNKHVKSLILSMSALSPVLTMTVAEASEFQYTAIEVGYSKSSIKANAFLTKYDIDGLSASATYSVTPDIVVGGSYGTFSGKTTVLFNGAANRTATDVTASGPSVFAFYHREVMPKADIQIGASYTKTDAEFKAGNTVVTNLTSDDTSKSVIGGLRYRFNEQLELGLNLDYDLDADEDELAYSVSARYLVADDIEAGLTFEPDSDGDTVSVSVRKYFDI